VLCNYIGTDQRKYLDYRDAGTGRVLEVSPGGSYDIEVASGQAAGLPLPPGDGRWVVAASAARDDHGRWLAAPAQDEETPPAQDGEIETPAPAEAAPPAAEEPAPPVPAAEPEPAAPDTPEEAGVPAEEES
jgi:hypothetical protein